jgi:hypothetical protein
MPSVDALLTLRGRRAGTRQQCEEHFPAKHGLGLDPGKGTGSPQKMRPIKDEWGEFEFYWNGIRSCARAQ